VGGEIKNHLAAGAFGEPRIWTVFRFRVPAMSGAASSFAGDC